MVSTLKQQKLKEERVSLSKALITCDNCKHMALTKERREVHCKSCPTGNTLKTIGANLWDVDKTESVLEKKEDMTMRDVMYLLDLGVPKTRIHQALGMNPNEFNRMISDFMSSKPGWLMDFSVITTE